MRTTVILLATIHLSAVLTYSDVFFDDFNRPNSQLMDNGWLQAGSDGTIGIIDGQATNTASTGSEAAMFRQFNFNQPVTVSATLRAQNGTGGSQYRYATQLLTRSNGTIDSGGLGIGFYTSEGPSNSSIVFLFDGRFPLYGNTSPFNFTGEIQTRFTVQSDGSISGVVADAANSYSFTFPARPGVTSTGSNFAFYNDFDSSGRRDARLDNLALSSGRNRSYQAAAPTPTASKSTPSFLQTEITSRMGQWDPDLGRFTSNLIKDGIGGDDTVYIITHGWAPGMLDEVKATPGAKAWQLYSSDPNSSRPWGEWMGEMAAAIHSKDPTALVLAYSWIDHSATPSKSEPHLSRASTDGLGANLGALMSGLLNDSFSGNVKLIGHSHGSRVATLAALSLEQQGVQVARLTLLDSPEYADASDFVANNLDRLLPRLKKIGTAADETFVENYFSWAGDASHVTGVVNIRLQGSKDMQDSADAADLHGYPYTWYTGSTSPNSNSGLNWQGGNAPSANTWKQDWLIEQSDGTLSEDLGKQYRLVQDVSAEVRQTTERVPKMQIYYQEGTVAGSTPAMMLRLEEHSPAFADVAMETQLGDLALFFDYEFNSTGDGDQLGIWINDEVYFVITGWDSVPGIQTGSIDLSGFEPGTQLVTIALHSYGEANADISVGNFRVLSVPEPSITLLFFGIIIQLRNRVHRARSSSGR